VWTSSLQQLPSIWHVQECETPAQARTWLATTSADLILLDAETCPGADAEQCALTGGWGDARVVVMAGTRQPRRVREALEAGARAYLFGHEISNALPAPSPQASGPSTPWPAPAIPTPRSPAVPGLRAPPATAVPPVPPEGSELLTRGSH
jgi:hypothetical protein